MRNEVQLCTYVNRFGGNDLADLNELLTSELGGLFGGVHLLPFYYPIDGADAGFDPIDHTKVDERLGTWKDVGTVGANHEIVADLIVNHMSADSDEFLDFKKLGAESEYSELFLTFRDVFPDGATGEDLLEIYRPRPGFPFTRMKLDTGEKVIAWTTFTKKQIDINVKSDAGETYLTSVLDALHEGNVKMVRLDAAGYSVKEAGTSCFMTPETFDFIQHLSAEAGKRGMTTLVEIHAHFQTQIEIAKKADWVYDFALPPLTLHTLYEADSAPLQQWYTMSPRNAVTVLDTHDGIGVIDIASEGDKEGLLTDQQIDSLVENMHMGSEQESVLATGAAASNVDLYQVNGTFYEALGSNDNDYLLARLIQFFSPGIPQVYYVGLLAGSNDMDLLERTRTGRDINRTYYTREDVAEELKREVVQDLFGLIRFRNAHPAFNGEFTCHVTDPTRLSITWVTGDARLDLRIDLAERSFVVKSTEGDVEATYTAWKDFKSAS